MEDVQVVQNQFMIQRKMDQMKMQDGQQHFQLKIQIIKVQYNHHQLKKLK